MIPLFQLSTRSYDVELPKIKKALDELEVKCNIKEGYELGEPSFMAGWAFFNLKLTQEMQDAIESSGMMSGALGFRIGEQLKNFLGHFMEQHGSQVRIKQIGY